MANRTNVSLNEAFSRIPGPPVWDGKLSTAQQYEDLTKLYILATKRDERYLCGPT